MPGMQGTNAGSLRHRPLSILKLPRGNHQPQLTSAGERRGAPAPLLHFQHGKYSNKRCSSSATHQERCELIVALPIQRHLLFLHSPRILASLRQTSDSVDRYFNRSTWPAIYICLFASSCVPFNLPWTFGLVQRGVLGLRRSTGCDCTSF
jgi:hypothetical protein